MIQLPANTSPLEFKLRALDPQGYLNKWWLTATKGSNHSVGLVDGTTAAAPSGNYGEEEFCAYSFELWGQDRTTNRVSGYNSHREHEEVVGMRAPEMLFR